MPVEARNIMEALAEGRLTPDHLLHSARWLNRNLQRNDPTDRTLDIMGWMFTALINRTWVAA